MNYGKLYRRSTVKLDKNNTRSGHRRALAIIPPKGKKWEGEKERRDIIPITRTSTNRRREPIWGRPRAGALTFRKTGDSRRRYRRDSEKRMPL